MSKQSIVIFQYTMLSNRPGAARSGENVTGLDELQNSNPGLNHFSKVMKLILLKLTLEIFKTCVYLWPMFVTNILFND